MKIIQSNIKVKTNFRKFNWAIHPVLSCRICECPILVGDEVVNKSQKLYHAKCYDLAMEDEESRKEFGLRRRKVLIK